MDPFKITYPQADSMKAPGLKDLDMWQMLGSVLLYLPWKKNKHISPAVIAPLYQQGKIRNIDFSKWKTLV